MLQGLSCSRCDTFSDCCGCFLEGEERIAFKPGDHLTIQFDQISQELINKVMLSYIFILYACLPLLLCNVLQL